MTEKKRYLVVLAITVIIAILEIFGAIISGSLALFADAGHVVIDGVAILVAVFVAYLVEKQTSENAVGTIRKRGGNLSALLLLAICGWIIVEAIDRIKNPPEIRSVSMLVIATAGAIGNWIQHRILVRSSARHITHRWISLHVITDLMQSVAVVVGGIFIALTGYMLLDPMLSLGIAIFMIMQALMLLLTGEHYHDCTDEHSPRSVS
ncbi:MAG: cation diffusion facilitator family transporter [bacterium]|nr:cation diffusion facilitator family transporter [bacterium]